MIKKITLLLLFVVAFSWQGTAQSVIHITTSGGSFSTEKWVSITDGVDGTGTQIWGQGDGTYGNGAGLIDLDISIAPGTYYVNCYDKYADSWDGTTILVTAYGNTIGDNGGVSPNDGTDTDASSAFGDTQAQELEASFQIIVPQPPTTPPNCDATLTTTTDAPIVDIAWSAATGYPTGYKLTIGTTSGAADVENATDVGNVTSYTFTTPLATGTTYYVTITPYNDNGDATGCVEQTFTTYTPPANDECSGAEILTAQGNVADFASATVTAGTVEFAMDSGIAAPVCDGYTGDANDDVWYSFVATAVDLNITVDDAFDGVVELFSGACGALTHVDCKDSTPEIAATGLTEGDTYYVRVYNYGTSAPTDATFNIAVWTSNALGITDNAIAGFAYYPNPVNNQLSLRANNTIDQVEILNILGQTVLTAKPSTTSTAIDMTALNQGAYFVRVQAGDAIQTVKVIKN